MPRRLQRSTRRPGTVAQIRATCPAANAHDKRARSVLDVGQSPAPCSRSGRCVASRLRRQPGGGIRRGRSGLDPLQSRLHPLPSTSSRQPPLGPGRTRCDRSCPPARTRQRQRPDTTPRSTPRSTRLAGIAPFNPIAAKARRRASPIQVPRRFRVSSRGSSSTWAACNLMNPQLVHVSGNASARRSSVPLPIAWSSVTCSSHPCQSSWPQNGQDMRAPRLRKKSKTGGFAVIRIATVAHRPSAAVLRGKNQK